MRKLASTVTVLVGSILFAASAAPASNTSDKGHGAIEVYVSGSPKWRSMDINGTAGADRLRIDRKPGRGPYVIKGNLPVVSTGGSCEQVSRRVLECRLPDGRYHSIGVFVSDGRDSVVMAARHYANLVVFAGAGADRVIGGRESDGVAGSAGADVIRGRGEWDFLQGEEGRDALNGGYGRDRLNGGPGRDRCAGGPGRDNRHRC